MVATILYVENSDGACWRINGYQYYILGIDHDLLSRAGEDLFVDECGCACFAWVIAMG